MQVVDGRDHLDVLVVAEVRDGRVVGLALVPDGQAPQGEGGDGGQREHADGGGQRSRGGLQLGSSLGL